MRALLILLVLTGSSVATQQVHANLRCSSYVDGGTYDCADQVDAGVPTRTTMDGGTVLITPSEV